MGLELNNKIIFIGGSGRTGTNITRHIFSLNKDIGSLPFEYRFIIDPDGIIDFYNSFNSWSPYYYDLKLKRLDLFLTTLSKKSIKKEKYIDWELNKYFPHFIKYKNELIEKLTDFEYDGKWPGSNKNKISFINSNKNIVKSHLKKFIEKNIKDFLNLNSKKHFVEDNTWNILYADTLYDFFPNSKLIHLIRDPRDVISSFVNQSWTPNNIDQAIDFYSSIINRWLEIEKSLDKNFYKVIKLEDLVQNPKKIISQICDFTNLQIDENMFNVNLTKSNKGRWKKNISKDYEKKIKAKFYKIYEKYY